MSSNLSKTAAEGKPGDARTYLLTQVAQLSARGVERLPTIRQLSASSGFAVNTLMKRVRVLCDEGVLESRPGYGIHIRGACAPPGSVGQDHRYCWQRLAADLRTRLAAQAATGSPEPFSLKQLRRQYGVSYPTVRRAMDYLVSEGIVRRTGRAYRVVQLGTPRAGGRVVGVMRGGGGSEVEAQSEPHRGLVRELERTCRRAGLSFGPAFLSFDARGRMRGCEEAHRLVREDSTVMGCVVLTEGVEFGTLGGLLGDLARTGKPVAILDRGELQARLPRISTSRRVRLFAPSVLDDAGRDMARYLLGLGHRRFVYVEPHDAPAWSERRFAGLRHELAKHDVETQVTRFALKRTRASVGPLLSFCGKLDRQVYGKRCELHEGDHLHTTYGDVLGGIAGRLKQLRTALELAGSVTPLVDELLKSRGTTAVVGANDLVACSMLDALRERGVGVPERFSVVGFDDTTEALAAGLTSYDFRFPELLARMLDFVVRPSGGGGGKHAARAIRHPGRVVERRSCAACL